MPGRNVILNVEADERPDGISLRLMSAVPLEDAAQRAGKSLTIETSDTASIASIRAQLKPGSGQVTFIVARDNRQFQVEVKERFQLTPALAGALKGLDGVREVRLS